MGCCVMGPCLPHCRPMSPPQHPQPAGSCPPHTCRTHSPMQVPCWTIFTPRSTAPTHQEKPPPSALLPMALCRVLIASKSAHVHLLSLASQMGCKVHGEQCLLSPRAEVLARHGPGRSPPEPSKTHRLTSQGISMSPSQGQALKATPSTDSSALTKGPVRTRVCCPLRVLT